jgi:hypothetical protein
VEVDDGWKRMPPVQVVSLSYLRQMNMPVVATVPEGKLARQGLSSHAGFAAEGAAAAAAGLVRPVVDAGRAGRAGRAGHTGESLAAVLHWYLQTLVEAAR